MAAGATLFLGLGLMSYAAYAANPGDACSPEGVMGVNQDVAMTCTGGVWVLNALQLGDKSVTCDSGKAGYMRYSGGQFEGCDGSSWVQLVNSGAPTYLGATPTSYSGALGGYVGANAKCVTAFGTGARMMTLTDATRLHETTAISGGWINCLSEATYIAGASPFYACGHAYTSTYTYPAYLDCTGYTSSNTGMSGFIYYSGGFVAASHCGSSHPILCVRD